MDSFSTDKIAKNLNPVEFVEGLYHGAIQRPVDAILQLCGHKVDPSHSSSDSLAGKAGEMAGQIIDFSLLAVASKGALKPLMKEQLGTTAGLATNMFVAGAVDGALLTPSDGSKGLLTSRLENGLVSGATFATMGGVSEALKGVSALKGETFMAGGLRSALSGGAGGLVSANLTALTNEGRLANASEMAGTAGQYAAFGFGLHALQAGSSKAFNAQPVHDAYLRSKWAVRDGMVEAKRMTYAGLNEIGMRHPLQRAGDFVYGLNSKPAEPKPVLTAENHPITAFERSTNEYLDKMQETEARYAEAPRESRRDIWEQLGQTKANYAEQLIRIVRGQGDQPGIASYTDAELATHGHSIERVSAIRDALGQSMKNHSYRTQSPFEAAMEKLTTRDVSDIETPFDLQMGLDQAKERFFGYDERKLSSMLGLPREQHYWARSYGTPVNWMPFEPTDNLANLFHTTTSRALDSILTERALLPARELRLRGITQATGESATEEFPRRAISLTRNFPEAFCYLRHSPAYLADYPIVMGVSRDVASRAYPAGMTEPGEILIDKLRFGTSILEKLGLRKPDVTHLYAPDSQIDAISKLMAQRRVKGVKVVGFNQLREPEWKPIPELHADEFAVAY